MRHIFAITLLAAAMTAHAAVPPFSNDCSSMTGFKVIDANGDGKTFKLQGLLNQETGETDMCFRNESPAGGCDDWLVVPVAKLTAGTYYEFSADIRAWSDKWAETFEIYVGTKSTVAGMTTLLQEATTIKHNTYRRYTAGFMPEKTGNYYFAIRHCNASEGFYMMVDNIAVDIAATNSAPAAPADLVIEPDYGGALRADIRFTAPTQTLTGDEVALLQQADVYRDGVLIATIDNPVPGQPYTYTDTGMTEDYHEYGVSITNEYGTSPKATSRRFCGIPLPAPPASCHIVETDVPGQVTMTWEPVTKDADGYDLNPDLLTYVVVMVENGEMRIRGKLLTGTSYTFDALPEGLETSVAYGGVYAYTRDYSATAPGSNTLIVGKAYDLPYHESYANATPSYIFATARTAGHGGEWGIYASASDGMAPQDNDGGFAACKISYKESSSKLMLGKFNMPNEDGIKLSFWYYPYVEEGELSNTVDVWVTDSEGELHEVATVEQAGEVRVWQQAEIDLSEFRGQTVRIELNVTCVSITFTMLDNISITSMADGIATPVAPATVGDDQAYDLQGRRIGHSASTRSRESKGITIINGKKIIR